VGGLVVTGRSANITEGREFTARTIDALPVTIVEPAAGSHERPLVQLASSYTPSAIQTGSPYRIQQERLAAEQRQSRVQGRRRAR
jgi:hypothetical protein